MIKAKLDKARGFTFFLRSFFVSTAEAVSVSIAEKIKMFPVKRISDSPLSIIIGAKTAIAVPVKATAIPTFSRFVTLSLKKYSPAATISKGPMRAISPMSRTVERSRPRNRRAMVMGTERRPCRSIKGRALLSFGSFIILKASSSRATVAASVNL